MTASGMEQLYQRIIANVNASVSASVAAASLSINNELQNQVSLLNSRMNQMQQQLVANQRNIQPPPPTVVAGAPVKKILKNLIGEEEYCRGYSRNFHRRQCYLQCLVNYPPDPSCQCTQMGNSTSEDEDSGA